jgi:hypothetical protein
MNFRRSILLVVGMGALTIAILGMTPMWEPMPNEPWWLSPYWGFLFGPCLIAASILEKDNKF